MASFETVDILGNPSQTRLRREIGNICDSYSHPWDVLAELCQNAVDAIRRHAQLHTAARDDHCVEIVVNAQDRSISVRDTGVGFPTESLEELLGPHGTDKAGDEGLIGEKGVGLTYTIYMSNKYELRSVGTNGRIEGTMVDASDWKNGRTAEMPLFRYKTEVSESPPTETYTLVRLAEVEHYDGADGDLFEQSFAVVKYWLRTRTAIGDTNAVFTGDYEPNFRASLQFVDKNGESLTDEVTPRYMLPEEFVPTRDVLLMDTEFYERFAPYDEAQKRNALQGKCLKKAGQVSRAGRWIDYYCFCVPSRDLWDDISKTQGLVEDDAPLNVYEGLITVATKGMPTGIALVPPQTGWSGYWPNMFILLNDDAVTFDLGRKSIPGRTAGLHREIAKELFNEIYKYLRFSGEKHGGARPSATEKWERDAMLKELAKLPDLGLEQVGFLKQPTGQEAGVVALFHELVGARLLKGYYTYKVGYKMTYDQWGLYRVNKRDVGKKFAHLANKKGLIEGPVVIEFKFDAESIVKDFEVGAKYFPSIDLIVCWDIDEARFTREGIGVRVLAQDDVFFYGSNYEIRLPSFLGDQLAKPVLALRPFVRDLLANS